MVQPTERVPLAQAIAELRAEIREAAARATNDSLKFRVSNIELEFTVVAEDAAETGGEVGWWILKAGAKVSEKDVVTHKVKLSLTPIGDIAVGDPQKTD